jgi:hypothetical protein
MDAANNPANKSWERHVGGGDELSTRPSIMFKISASFHPKIHFYPAFGLRLIITKRIIFDLLQPLIPQN